MAHLDHRDEVWKGLNKAVPSAQDWTDVITSSHKIKDLKPVNVLSWAWKWLMNP